MQQNIVNQMKSRGEDAKVKVSQIQSRHGYSRNPKIKK